MQANVQRLASLMVSHRQRAYRSYGVVELGTPLCQNCCQMAATACLKMDVKAPFVTDKRSDFQVKRLYGISIMQRQMPTFNLMSKCFFKSI